MRWALLALMLAGCLESQATTCEDGTLCPAGSVCTEQGCVLEEQVVACEGRADGETCSFSGVPAGRCVDGVCLSFGCGNGIEETDQGEVCDDGNNESGDGCRGDCRKDEVCGDGEIDASELGVGEQCDDMNANPADACDACAKTTWAAEPLIGGDIPATTIGLGQPQSVAVDAAGNVYIADTYNQKIRRVDVDGNVVTIAGNGAFAVGHDDQPATSEPLFDPYGVAIDGLGTVYIAEMQSHRIRRVDPTTGLITTVAGKLSLVGAPSPGYSGDDEPATGAELDTPTGVAVDGLGNLYIADTGNDAIRRVDGATGVITTFATGLSDPAGVAVDALGNVYIADTLAHRIRRVDPLGVATTVAGTGVAGGLGDDGLATVAQIDTPKGVAVDADGNLYIAEHFGHRIRRVDAVTGIITTLAGTGDFGFDEDGVAATTTRLWQPDGVAVGRDGVVTIADTTNNRVRQVDTDGFITTLAGTGGFGVSGDGGAAISAQLHLPSSVVVDGSVIYFAESSAHRVRRVDLTTRIITTVAGTAIPGFEGDGGLATAARINTPQSLALHGDSLYIAELYHRVRKVDLATGIITRVAGTGAAEFSGDDGPAVDAELRSPTGIAVDAAGNLYIAEYGNHTIRRVDAVTGIITTIAGTGEVGGATADGELAVDSLLNEPRGLAIDADGNIFVSELASPCRLYRIDADTGIKTTLAANFAAPYGLGVDAAGDVYVADRGGQVVQHVDGDTGAVTTVVGELGVSEFGRDGGLATNGWMRNPEGVAVGADGAIYVADTDNHRVRRVDPATDIITTVAGPIDPEGTGPLAQARLAEPRAFVRGTAFTLAAGGSTGIVQVLREADDWLEGAIGRYPQVLPTAALARYRSNTFGDIGGLAFDETAGVVYLTETTADTIHVVTIVDPDDVHTWTIEPLAIAGTLRGPTGLFLDGGTLYVADTGNHAIRRIELDDGSMSTLAGTPETLGFFGDTEQAIDALLYAPEAITRCDNGDFFIADTGNNRVRRVADGIITTVLGDGVASSSGQGDPASQFPVRAPRGLACDSFGNLYVTSSSAVRQLDAVDEVVDGDGPVRSIFGGPPFDSLEGVTHCLTGVVILDDATLRITDSCTGMLIELTRETGP